MTDRQDTTVLYIAGAGRSGSTLLEMILGNIDGFFSVGECRHIWEYASRNTMRCGCGKGLWNCEFWHAVLGAHSRSKCRMSLETLDTLAKQWDRTRHLPKLRLCDGRNARLQALVDATAMLYREIAGRCGAQILVDASKTPSHLWILQKIPELEIRVLHLVRDVRAVAHAWRQRRKQEYGAAGDQYRRMPRRSLLRSTAGWMVENAAAERLGTQAAGYTRMRYEDFTEAPRKVLTAALDDLGLDDPDLSFVNREGMTLQPTHSVGGNPVRFIDREFAIARDDRWRDEMRPWRQSLAGGLARPLLNRYGYRPVR